MKLPHCALEHFLAKNHPKLLKVAKLAKLAKISQSWQHCSLIAFSQSRSLTRALKVFENNGNVPLAKICVKTFFIRLWIVLDGPKRSLLSLNVTAYFGFGSKISDTMFDIWIPFVWSQKYCFRVRLSENEQIGVRLMFRKIIFESAWKEIQ